MGSTSKVNTGYMIFLAMVAAIGGFMFGYDTAVISGTVGQVSTQFGLDTLMQGWFVGCALIGSIAGVLIAGYMSDKLGRRVTLFFSAILFLVSAVGCAISGTFTELVVARMIGGVAIGVVSIVSPLYISEISVAEKRGQMVSFYQLAITIGFLGAYLVNFALMGYSKGGAAELSDGFMKFIFHDEVWRSMLGMALVPATCFFFVLFFVPESPRWLLLKQQEKKAEGILLKIYGSAKQVASEIGATQKALGNETKANWRVLLEPGIRRAVLIGAAIAILGQFMGVNAVLYYGPEIFQAAGLSGDDSLFYQIFIGAVNMGTTVIAMFIIDKIGRKKLVYFGVSGMILGLILIASYFTFGADLGMPSVMLLIFFLFYVFSCAISISAVIFVFLSEMFPLRVRGLAMSIAGLSLWIGTYLIGQLTPWMLEELTPAGTFMLFAAMCIPYMLIVWKLMPETAGKSLEEIEEFWETNK